MTEHECIICFESIVSEKCELICKHEFHLECIKKWFGEKLNPSCPLCRSTATKFSDIRVKKHKLGDTKIQWMNDCRPLLKILSFPEMMLRRFFGYTSQEENLGDFVTITLLFWTVYLLYLAMFKTGYLLHITTLYLLYAIQLFLVSSVIISLFVSLALGAMAVISIHHDFAQIQSHGCVNE